MSDHTGGFAKVTIPLPLLLVVDDVGWWNGSDGSPHGEPFRTGIRRSHCLDDYRVLAELGQSLGMRIPVAMVLCEWDIENLLKDVPTATWMGRSWDTSAWRGEHLNIAADFLRDHSEFVEIALHGVGHEYWDRERTMRRAEFADEDGKPRDGTIIRRHLDAFRALLDQHRLGSFPSLFVPPDSRHCFGSPELAGILKEYGVDFVITPFAAMQRQLNPQHRWLGVDHRIATIDRGRSPCRWNQTNAIPATRSVEGPILGVHWANLIHDDPQRNGDVLTGWKRFLRSLESLDVALAKSTLDCWTQLAHHAYTRVSFDRQSVTFDFARLHAMQLPRLGSEFRFRYECVSSPGVWEQDIRNCATRVHFTWSEQGVHSTNRVR